MKSKIDTETTPEQKYTRFQSALRSIVQVSKNDLSNMPGAPPKRLLLGWVLLH